MTGTNTKNNYPKSLSFSKKESNIKLIVHGQGVLIFNVKDTEITKECSFRVYNKSQTNGIKIKFTLNNVLVHDIQSDEPLLDSNNNKGLTNKNGAYYWFSIDSQNQRLYAGIGEARIANVIYKYEYDQNKLNKTFLESLVTIHIPKTSNSYLQTLVPLKLLRDPITENIPLLIRDTNYLTMDDIASNAYLPASQLSTSSKQLYDCISGENFVLDTDDFPLSESDISKP
jgi:hypothetical protein